MNIKMKRNSLKGWVYAHYGDLSKMAEHLGLDVSTISHWVRSNPRNMLRFIPEIRKQTGQTADQIVLAVMERLEEIQEDDQ